MRRVLAGDVAHPLPSPLWNNGGQLSATDVAAVRQLYGTRTP